MLLWTRGRDPRHGFTEFCGGRHLACFEDSWSVLLMLPCGCAGQVFEKLGPSLFDFLRRNDYQPFPMPVVRELAAQVSCCANLVTSCCYVRLLLIWCLVLEQWL